MTTTQPPAAQAGETTPLLAPAYRWSTVGMVSLVFLGAFEALAVTTIMPSVAADLDGQAWFSAAFSVTLAAGVVGMVAGGLWSDRRGPRMPLLVSVAVFAGGLLLAGLAPGIEVFVAARFFQGLGAGAMTVALYVVVARIYAPVDHARIFGAFAAAWVVPSMIGPTIAGAAAEAFGWRWVFLGVVALAASATLALRPALEELVDTPEPSSVATTGRLALAGVVAGGVVVLDLVGRATDGVRWPVAALAVVAVVTVVVLAVRPLLPAGTLTARPGLPAVVALRGAIGATFFATEIYLPYLLQEHYDVAPWLSGATLTVGALGWSGASHVQARLGPRVGDHAALRIGAALLLGGVAGELLATTLRLSPVLVASAWVLAGAGMGLMFPRISSLVLAASSPRDQGGNSAAMSISDAVGSATAISVSGLVFTAVGPASAWAPFLAVLALTTAFASGAVLVARRTS